MKNIFNVEVCRNFIDTDYNLKQSTAILEIDENNLVSVVEMFEPSPTFLNLIKDIINHNYSTNTIENFQVEIDGDFICVEDKTQNEKHDELLITKINQFSNFGVYWYLQPDFPIENKTYKTAMKKQRLLPSIKDYFTPQGKCCLGREEYFTFSGELHVEVFNLIEQNIHLFNANSQAAELYYAAKSENKTQGGYKAASFISFDLK